MMIFENVRNDYLKIYIYQPMYYYYVNNVELNKKFPLSGISPAIRIKMSA